MANKDPDREELLREIQEWQFVATELTLFLDTHPENREALRDYNMAHERLRNLHRQWETRYGPLTSQGHSPSQYPWQWVEEPWPWELEKCKGGL
ncbi:MAG: spore coat protein CotJB [Peptococcaceae bacterium]|nr:spore coat protein CotJB [Peptococcaceae bacterium]